MKIIQYISAALLSFVLLGCNMTGSIDNIKLDNVLTDEDLIVDAPSAETALNGVYSSWRNIDIGWFVNHVSLLTKTINNAPIVGTAGFATNDVKPENEMIARNYTALYRVVNMSNSVIAKLEKDAPKDIEPGRLKEMTAEGRFHRALAHLMLLRQYGEFYNLTSSYGIVIYDTPARSNTPKARASVQDTYNFILADLEFASENAPKFTPYHYMVSSITCKALQSRVLLYMHRFDKAAAVAESVINDAPAAGYVLENDYLNIFRKRFNSDEVLFAPYASYPNQLSVVIAMGVNTGAPFQKVADELVPGVKNLKTGAGLDPRFAMAFSENAFNAENNASTRTNKYPAATYNDGDPMNTTFLLRLAEVYLIKAEADARMKRFDDSRRELQAIAGRAGYAAGYAETIADQNLLEMIFKHKWMELAYENNEEWFDMVRMHTLDNMAIAPAYVATDRHLCLPIPKTALAGNNLLIQNPAYTQN